VADDYILIINYILILFCHRQKYRSLFVVSPHISPHLYYFAVGSLDNFVFPVQATKEKSTIGKKGLFGSRFGGKWLFLHCHTLHMMWSLLAVINLN